MTGFAELISNRRDELGLSLAHVSDAIERSEAVLGAWENGKTFPEDPEIVAPLAKVLKLPTPLLREAFVTSSPASDVAFEAVVDEEAEVEKTASIGDEQLADEVHEDEMTDEVGGPPRADSQPESPGSEPESPGPEPDIPAWEEPRASSPPTGGWSPPSSSTTSVPLDQAEGSEWSEQLSELISAPFAFLMGRYRRRRRVSRAVTAQPSYVEDRKQRTTYQLRAIFTGAAVLIMVLLIRWAWSNFADAFGTLWQTIVDAI